MYMDPIEELCPACITLKQPTHMAVHKMYDKQLPLTEEHFRYIGSIFNFVDRQGRPLQNSLPDPSLRSN